MGVKRLPVRVLAVECPCGAVKLELHGEPRAQLYCHCDDCQVAHAAAYVPVEMVPYDAVKIVQGAPVMWKRKTTPRATCATCGTRLFAEPPGMGIRGVMASLLPPDHFAPTLHVFCRFARLPVRDGLPHYATVPAAFGGSDETVDW
jgi:hypothetical protein